MTRNPFLRKLGFSEDERVVIAHGDDIGMCQASIQAYEDLFKFGTLKSGAVMVPCPWFPAAAELQRRLPEADLGVHLVLTSEWRFYRWGPVTGPRTASTLVDDEGYFPRTEQEIQTRGDPDEALSELEAQIERALAFGIDATHADMHMFAIAHPKFIPGYVELVRKYRLPPLIPRGDWEAYQLFGVDEETYSLVRARMDDLEAEGIPLVDAAVGLPLDDPRNHVEVAKRMFSELKPGLTHFILHPSIDTPELRAITPDWECRVENYRAFLSDELKKHIEKEGITLIGYREIRAVMRRSETENGK
ncbi:MAG: polysaccharide deacetylase family protein [Bacteroidota bacterium]